MRYVDGFVLPVPTKNLKIYKKLAADAGKIWMKHGALEYVECVGKDMTTVKEWQGLPFTKLAKTKKNESVIFSFIIYKSKAHRDAVNKKVMKDPFMNDPKNTTKKMPFKMEQMAYGGFQSIVDLH
jgi:uncharacterized protein YbaA (DUF1428 family)